MLTLSRMVTKYIITDVFTDLLEDFVCEKRPPLVCPSLALLQCFRRHEHGVWSLCLLCQKLDNHCLYIKEEHVHIRICQVGLHGLDHKCIVGVFWQVTLKKRRPEISFKQSVIHFFFLNQRVQVFEHLKLISFYLPHSVNCRQ